MSYQSFGRVRTKAARRKVDAKRFMGEYPQGTFTILEGGCMGELIRLSLIVAMTPERIIGNKGKLPWGTLPSDLAHFWRITMAERVLIMGRETYDSIILRNGAPLPERRHIVLTRKATVSPFDSVRFVGSVEEAYADVAAHEKKACVIGGGEIYRLFLPMPEMTRAYITTVHAPDLVGDTYFPTLVSEPSTEWIVKERDPARIHNVRDKYETTFETYERVDKV